MENQNNDVFSDIVNNHRSQIQDNEVINFANKHHYENKVAPNLEAPKVTDFKIDYEGKEYQKASKESKKMDRRTFLKLLGATALAAMGYKMAKDKIGPEIALATAMQKTSDLIEQIVAMDPSFENNTEFKTATNENGKFYIESSDKKGYDDLINYLTTYSKNSDGKDAGKGLSHDQAIYAISLCGRNADCVPDNLYETYYNLSQPEFMESYFKGPGSEINGSAYQNYMQSGKSIKTGVITGIPYAEGIKNLEQNIYLIDEKKESGKAL